MADVPRTEATLKEERPRQMNSLYWGIVGGIVIIALILGFMHFAGGHEAPSHGQGTMIRTD